jgi:hypothetical protein
MAGIRRLKESISERLASAWRLLSSTTTFLGRTPEFDEYESQLKEWRRILQTASGDTEKVRAVRDEIIALRRELRFQGYDLTAWNLDLRVKDFRNEASVLEGYSRLVTATAKDGRTFFEKGDDNHVSIARRLEVRLGGRDRPLIVEWHYLWYKWQGDTLFLSGSDTEDPGDFERLKRRAENNKMKFLAGFRDLP